MQCSQLWPLRYDIPLYSIRIDNKFFVANNIKLAGLLKSDGVYISSSNKSFRPLHLNKSLFTIIGSAHNFKEIHLKIKQGCQYIIVSKIFKVDYDPTAKFMGVVKFNNLLNSNKNIIPLGGIKSSNLNKLRFVKSFGKVSTWGR